VLSSAYRQLMVKLRLRMGKLPIRQNRIIDLLGTGLSVRF
jgi:hypothetical protein